MPTIALVPTIMPTFEVPVYDVALMEVCNSLDDLACILGTHLLIKWTKSA